MDIEARSNRELMAAQDSGHKHVASTLKMRQLELELKLAKEQLEAIEKAFATADGQKTQNDNQ